MKTVLAKFEAPAFIHTHVSSRGARGPDPAPELLAAQPAAAAAARPATTLLFEFPRYGLEFELQGGTELLSRNFTVGGWCGPRPGGWVVWT